MAMSIRERSIGRKTVLQDPSRVNLIVQA